MIDLQELRKAAEWLNKERNDLPKDANIMDFEDRKIQIVPSQFIELIDRLEAAEAVCMAVKESLPTIHVMDTWKQVKEGQ